MSYLTDGPGLARTSGEAHLYMDMNPCECGSGQFRRNHDILTIDGAMLSRYHGPCSGCGKEREFLLRLPVPFVRTPDGEVFFGDGRSELLDAGEWLFVAERYAATAPANPPADVGERTIHARTIATAAEAVRQARAFVDETGTVQPYLLLSPHSKRIATETPDRLHDWRLAILEKVYLDLLARFVGPEETA